jgi:hypothetical protein
MKFICQDGRRTELLKQWASNRDLVEARYFSWNSGDELQMSQAGLLRTLLYDALRSRNN